MGVRAGSTCSRNERAKSEASDCGSGSRTIGQSSKEVAPMRLFCGLLRSMRLARARSVPSGTMRVGVLDPSLSGAERPALQDAVALRDRGERLVIEPASCIACGYAFVRRARLTRPGSCPDCGSTRIDPPAFRI